MSKRGFDKSKKEKVIMAMSAALVVGACTVTGIYVNKMQQVKDNGYVVDLSELDEQISDTGELYSMTDEGGGETGNVNSDSVVNSLEDIPVEKGDSPVVEKRIEIPGVGYLDEIEASSKAIVNEEAPEESVTEPLSAGSGAALEAASEPVVLEFGIDDTMMWPLSGNVILNYSMDKTIYFPTLEQYKYNPGVHISGQEGTDISAAARGTVENIGNNEEIGQFIVMSLGDGYQVTYGGLKDIIVETGDLVSKGQVIAKLSEPTIYYSLEGANLYFEVTKDGTSVNPMDYMQ